MRSIQSCGAFAKTNFNNFPRFTRTKKNIDQDTIGSKPLKKKQQQN